MPVRRRKSKARAGEAEAWAGFMWSGHDYFDDLPDAGHNVETAAEVAEETWHRIGDEVLAHLDKMHVGFPPYDRPIWAERQFGPAKTKRRAGR